MDFLKWSAVSSIAILAAASCSAQHKFPLRSGEWSVTGPSLGEQPLLFCLNDDLWEKALTQNPMCTIQQLTISGGGASYSLNCPTKAFQMKGKVDLSFDGMEHMTGKAVIETTARGKTSTATVMTVYKWKSASCSPNDVNMDSEKPE